MKLLLALGSVALCLALVSALTCKSCSFRALSICFTSAKDESCTGNCSITKAFIGDTSLFTKQECEIGACISANKTKDSVFSIDYTTRCCTTDLCNSGNSVKISSLLG